MLALIIFALSGFAALLYQVIWQRLLVIFSGADVFSVTVIVAAFMAGLGFGSFSGGRLADRLSPRANLYAFAGAELGIGLFGLGSKPLYYDTLHGRFPQLAANQAAAAVVLFATLLVPTFLMGVSLPLLARALADRLQATPRVIGLLYGYNTLGAAAGAFAAPWILIPWLGLEQSLWIAAAVNGVCAALATRLAHAAQRSESPPAAADEVVRAIASTPFRTWVLLYALTGFIALGLEIVWFRLLGVLLKSTAFTFGTLLGIYLTGLGAGALIGARFVGRSSRPGVMFLTLQYSLCAYVALSVAVLVLAIAAGTPTALVVFLGAYDPVNVHDLLARIIELGWLDREALRLLAGFLGLYFVLPAVLIGPPTLLMGVSFPYLQKASQSDFSIVGERLGVLLASNIAGAVAGAVMTGWWMLSALGTAGSLRFLVGLTAIVAWPLAHLLWPAQKRRRLYTLLSAAVLTTLLVSVVPANASLWARLHGIAPRHMLFDEDGTGLSLLRLEGSGTTAVFVNGLGQSWLPYGGIHTALGALPAFIHPAPRDVAIIGLGSGDTAFGAAGRSEIARIVSIEILGAQRRTLLRLLDVRRDQGLLALMSDPRVEYRAGDGRAYLAHSGETFDIIEADALRPSSAHAGNLYSREYFTLLATRLRPGGYAVTWAPTDRTRATFMSVFPHVLSLGGEILIGSRTPIRYDPREVAARAAAAQYYFAVAGVDIASVLRPYLTAAEVLTLEDPRPTTALNTDMFPRDEFALPF